MTKIIKLTVNGKIIEREMDEREMLLYFDNIFNKFAHQCINKLSGYQNCNEDFDDFKQIAMIKAVEKFEDYDLGMNTNFSTILVTALKALTVDYIRKYETQKRKCEHKLVYIDAQIGESCDEVGSIISASKGDEYFVEKFSPLEKYLIKNLTKEEMLFYSIDLKKQIGKASPMQRFCLENTIDLFKMVIGSIPDKKEDVAILLGLSRPTLNKRIKETVKKVQELTKEFYLCNFHYTEIPSII